jgi:hypothetical protein
MNKNDTGWFRFDYNNKPRLGLVIGPDTRPGTNNVVCLVPGGIKTFNVKKMEKVSNETTIIV